MHNDIPVERESIKELFHCPGQTASLFIALHVILAPHSLVAPICLLSVRQGLWDLCCDLPQWYRTTLYTTDLPSAPPTGIVHHGSQGWSMSPTLFIFGGSHGTCTKWTLFPGRLRWCTRARTYSIVFLWLTTYTQITVDNVIQYRHTLW